MVYKENSKEVDIRKLIPIEEKLNTLFNKSLIPSPTKLQYPTREKFKDNKYNIKKYKKIIKGIAIMKNEITKKKALIGTAYMQIIILHRSYAVKQKRNKNLFRWRRTNKTRRKRKRFRNGKIRNKLMGLLLIISYVLVQIHKLKQQTH